METDGELDVKALVDIPDDKLSEIKTKTLAYTLGHVYWTRCGTRLRKCRPKVSPKH